MLAEIAERRLTYGGQNEFVPNGLSRKLFSLVAASLGSGWNSTTAVQLV